jgi:hypothetical protein
LEKCSKVKVLSKLRSPGEGQYKNIQREPVMNGSHNLFNNHIQTIIHSLSLFVSLHVVHRQQPWAILYLIDYYLIECYYKIINFLNGG